LSRLSLFDLTGLFMIANEWNNPFQNTKRSQLTQTDPFRKHLFLINILVRPLNTLFYPKDVKPRNAGAGFEPAAYGFET